MAPREQRAVGAAFSVLSGSGLSYTQTMPSGWGYHVAGVGWGQAGRSYVNVGGAITREIDRRPWGTLYGLLAAGAGIDSFAGGEGGLQGATTPQLNLSPGLGFTWGPIMLELGYSVYSNASGIGFGPGYGGGLYWWF